MQSDLKHYSYYLLLKYFYFYLYVLFIESYDFFIIFCLCPAYYNLPPLQIQVLDDRISLIFIPCI